MVSYCELASALSSLSVDSLLHFAQWITTAAAMSVRFPTFFLLSLSVICSKNYDSFTLGLTAFAFYHAVAYTPAIIIAKEN